MHALFALSTTPAQPSFTNPQTVDYFSFAVFCFCLLFTLSASNKEIVLLGNKQTNTPPSKHTHTHTKKHIREKEEKGERSTRADKQAKQRNGKARKKERKKTESIHQDQEE